MPGTHLKAAVEEPVAQPALPQHGDRIVPVPYVPGPGGRALPAARPRRGRTLLLAAAVLLLGLLGAHVLTARWVQIAVDPPADRLSLRGSLVPFALNRGFLLRPETDYTLVAEKTGYRTLEAPFRTTREPEQRFSFNLRKLPGALRVDTGEVVEAAVFVDGAARGRTPTVIGELEPGPHDLLIEAPRHLPFETRVDIEGMGREQGLKVELVPDWASVRIDALPAGAQLWVDGELATDVPATLELVAGLHRLELRLVGYKTWTRELEVKPAQAIDLGTVTLEEADAVLRLSSTPPAAAVTLDGRYVGKTPLGIELPVGVEHELLLARPGYRSRTHRVRLDRREEQTLTLAMEPITGAVVFRAEPSDAELYIDGEARGSANQRLELLTVRQQIEIRRAGYQTFRTAVTPVEGYSKEITARLRSVASGAPRQKTAANPPPRRPATSPDGTALVRIAPGSFRMGASRREQGRRSNEVEREVILTRPYYLAATEVSNAQFRRFAPQHGSGSFNGLALDGASQPVVNVTWEQAAEYCNWLSRQVGLTEVYERRGSALVAKRPVPNGYRLPTEAEWAWAARFAGRDRAPKYPWGDAMPPAPNGGNYADQSDASYLANTLYDYNDGFAATAPPGSFTADASGLHDMSGNVAEWVNDFYAIEQALGDGRPERDPLGPATGTHHVVRGSSWMSASISELRWTYRDYSKGPRPDLGFRVARYAD